MKHAKILALALGAAFVTPLAASAQMYGYHNGGYRQLVGVQIIAVHGSALTLASGRTVFLHNGTVINPVGRRLHAGEIIDVRGYAVGNGNVNANVINIRARW